jgi:hypothetical protein
MPMAAVTLQLPPPWPAIAEGSGTEAGKKGNGAHSKSCPSAPNPCYEFQNPANGMCKYHNFWDNKQQVVGNHAVIQKTKKPPSPTRLGSLNTYTCHSHAVQFPTNSGLNFLTDGLTSDKYLVDVGATFSIIPYSSNNKLSGPFLRGANGLPIPSWGFFTKVVQFQGKLFTFFFASRRGRSHPRTQFFEKI